MLLIDSAKYFLIIPVIILSLFLTACQNEQNQKKSGQALISIDGKEITTLQLNDEIKRSNIRVDQYDVASKQLLESLIARQLIVDEAVRNRLDRSPEVMRARERANSQVVAQFYLQELVSKISKPSKAEIEEYFYRHPLHFEKRKQFDLEVVRIAKKELNDELKEFIENAKSLNDVIVYLDKKNILFFQNEVIRSTSELPAELVAMILKGRRSQVFMILESETLFLLTVNKEKESPILFDLAASQIEKHLINQKYKQATDAEITRLRSLAKIEYLNRSISTDDGEKRIDPLSIAPTISNPLNLSPSSVGQIEHGALSVP